MRNTWLLLKIQLSNILGFNRIIHLKDKKERRKKMAARIAIYCAMLMVMPAIGMYAVLMAMGMDMLGQIALFPGVIMAALCVMTLFSSVSLANGTLFAFKDYDMTMSLPVKNHEIALSRLLLGYVSTCMLDLLIMIPCGAVYAYFARPTLSFYPIFFLTMLAAPVLPMIVGSLIGVFVARLMASFRGGKYLQMLGTTALCLAIMFGSMSMSDAMMQDMLTNAIFGNFGVMISGIMNRIYPLTGLYVEAVSRQNWLAAVGFCLISLAAMGCMALLLGRYMGRINSLLTAAHTKRRFRMRALNTSSPLMALYKKELRRYVSSTIYLFNTAFGVVLALIGVGVMAVKGRDVIGIVLSSMELVGVDEGLIVCALGYVGAFLVITCCTTCCSISLEGKNVWLIQSLPVSGFEVLLSKLMVNWTVSVPTAVLIGLGAGLTLQLGAGNTLMITAMALSYALMSAALGLMVNLKSHSFDWTTDAVVVKQSAATGISMLVNMALVLIPAVLGFVFTEQIRLVFWLAIAVNALLGTGMMAVFKAKGDGWLLKL